jgi:hypothetical protein
MKFVSGNKGSSIFKSALFALAALSLFAARASAQSSTFSANDYSLPGNSHVAADFNGDGKSDLAVTGLSLLVMLNNGDGTFRNAVSYPAGKNLQDVEAGDFNGDGKPDLALQILGASPRLTVLTNSTGTTTATKLAFGSVTAAPSSVAGGTSSTISVSLSPGAVAPSGGLKLSVSSGNQSVVTVPQTVTIPAGASSVSFNAGTSSVASTQTVTVNVSSKQLGSRSVTLTVTPPPAGAPSVLSLSLAPGTVTGGSAAQGTVKLNASVASATVVNLTSSSASASTPASVTVAACSSSATFTISTAAVSATASATISATLNGTTRAATLTINPEATTTTTDTVAVTLAEYIVSKSTLQIGATSTRSTATLKVFATTTGQLIGTLTNKGGGKYEGQFTSVANPQNVTVRSSLGGSATRAVTAK